MIPNYVSPIVKKAEEMLGMELSVFIRKIRDLESEPPRWEEGFEDKSVDPRMALLDANEDQLEEAEDLDWVVPPLAEPATPEAATYDDTDEECKAMATISKKRYGFAPKTADTDLIIRHEDYRTIHWGHRVCPETRLGCGKARGDKHKAIPEMPDLAWPLCGSCFPC